MKNGQQVNIFNKNAFEMACEISKPELLVRWVHINQTVSFPKVGDEQHAKHFACGVFPACAFREVVKAH